MKTTDKALDFLVRNVRKRRACRITCDIPVPCTCLRCVPLLTLLLLPGIARAELVIEIGSGSEIGLSTIDVVAGLWCRRGRAISRPERSPGMASAAVSGSV